MNRYYITVPTQYNDGTPVSPEHTDAIDTAADGLFGAYSVWQGAYGVWEGYQDPARTFVIDQQEGPERNVLAFAELVKGLLEQACVYVADHPIHTRLV